MKKAFTMIELIFVIVVLGILSAVALPKFAGTKNMADISKGRADVSAIRSAILTERQSQLIKGINTYIPKLCSATTDEILFKGDGSTGANARGRILQYGIVKSSAAGGWRQNGSCKKFYFKVDATDVEFNYYPTETTVSGTDYPAGTFTCVRGNDAAGKICKKLID